MLAGEWPASPRPLFVPRDETCFDLYEAMMEDEAGTRGKGMWGRRNQMFRSKGSRRAAVAGVASVLLLQLLVVAAPVVRAGATITVNTIDQEINDDGDCSLQGDLLGQLRRQHRS